MEKKPSLTVTNVSSSLQILLTLLVCLIPSPLVILVDGIGEVPLEAGDLTM